MEQAPRGHRVAGTVKWIQAQPEGTMMYLSIPAYSANPLPCTIETSTVDTVTLNVLAVFPGRFSPGTAFDLWTMDRAVVASGEVL